MRHCFVQFLEPQAVGATFAKSEWPLHCTLAGVFSWQWSDKAEADLRQLADTNVRFESHSRDLDHFGKREVRLIEKIDELTRLHNELIALIKSHGGTFDLPHFLHDKFTPHVTTQRHAALHSDSPVNFNQLSLVDLMPDGNRLQRQVVTQFPFGD